MIKKIVIPAAGSGSRLLSVTKEIPKEMMPIFIKNKSGKIQVKPVIQIIFQQFYSLGIRDYCCVVGKQKRAIEDHFTPDYQLLKNLPSNNPSKKDLSEFYSQLNKSRIFWINQLSPKGFGDAVMRTESFVGKDDFLVIAGDTLLLNNNKLVKRMMNIKLLGKHDAALLLQKVPDPKRFGVAVIKKTQQETYVTNVEEKPKRPKSNLSIVAFYRFKQSIFQALKDVKVRKSELQLTDGIQKLIERGGNVRAFILDENDRVIDIGTPESYLENLIV